MDDVPEFLQAFWSDLRDIINHNDRVDAVSLQRFILQNILQQLCVQIYKDPVNILNTLYG